MKSLFPPEWTREQRLDALQNTADLVTEGEYTTSLTTEELNVKREELAENTINLHRLDAKKKRITAEIKAESKPLVELNNALLVEIESRHARKEGKLFHMFDQDTGIAEVFDENGNQISERRLSPDEKVPKNLFSMNRMAQ